MAPGDGGAAVSTYRRYKPLVYTDGDLHQVTTELEIAVTKVEALTAILAGMRRYQELLVKEANERAVKEGC